MSRNPNLAVAFAALLVVLSGATPAEADKSLSPYARHPERIGERDRYERSPPLDTERHEIRQRPEGTQIFIGTPQSYDGYSPYYGPYIYGRGGRRDAGTPYVDPGYGSVDDGDCRRWAWEPKRSAKWLWGVIESSSGGWRCAEW